MNRLALFLLTGLSACHHRPPQHTGLGPWRPPWLSSELRVTPDANVVRSLAQPFDDAIPVVNARDPAATMDNCESYFRLRASGYSAVSNEEYDLMRLEGVRCHALRISATLKPVRAGQACALPTAQQALSQLSPTVGAAPSPDVRQMREASAHRGDSWAKYASSARVTFAHGELVVDEDEFVTELKPLATGDLDGDGKCDLLVQVVGHGREGNWREIRLLVLAQTDHAVSYRVAKVIVP